MASFVNRSDAEKQMTVARLLQLFDDDLDGQIAGDDLEALNEVMAEANDYVTAQLYLHGFSADQLNGLSRDRGIRRAAVQIFCEFAGTRRTEFINPTTGQGPYHELGKRAREYLKSLSKGELRSRLEEQHGKNPSTAGVDSIPDPPYIFSRDPNDPNDRFGPGGF